MDLVTKKVDKAPTTCLVKIRSYLATTEKQEK